MNYLDGDELLARLERLWPGDYTWLYDFRITERGVEHRFMVSITNGLAQWRVVTNDRYASKTRDEAAESFMSNVIDLARTHEHKFLFIKLADDLGVDIASAL